ncbi:MAG: ImmA/IrrE family metallo-endopeptidase [Bacillales bacterium]|nr:ImmA/IrrE family metallo-endopeptidase [Bacillales bacterium]
MDKILLQRYASETRDYFGVDPNSPIDLLSLINADPKFTLVFYPFKEDISGVCIKSANLIAVNCLSTVGRQRFSLAHELYHYFYDDKKTCVSYVDFAANNDKVEKEANIFASYLLMPDLSFSNIYKEVTDSGKNKIDIKGILKIEQYFRVSRQSLLVRLIMEGYITEEESSIYKNNIIKMAREYGYDISLYSQCVNQEFKTYGAYLKKAILLKEKNLISSGKYEEYLFDANRSDIIFNENGEKEIYD